MTWHAPPYAPLSRLGARKWAPRFDYNLSQQTFPALDAETAVDDGRFSAFLDSEIHGVLAECSGYRPTVDIAVLELNELWTRERARRRRPGNRPAALRRLALAARCPPPVADVE